MSENKDTRKPWEMGFTEDTRKPWEMGLTEAPEERSLTESLKRQLGLTARYATQGIVGAGDFLASPVRGALNLTLPKDKQIKPLGESVLQPSLDYLNTPKPETNIEKIVGKASETLVNFGTGSVIAKSVAPTSGFGKGLKDLLTKDLKTQAIASGGAGAGFEVADQAGLGLFGQMAAGLGTAIVSPVVSRKLLEKPMSALYKKIVNAPKANLDSTVTKVLESSLNNNNIKITDLDGEVISALKTDIIEATKINPNLSADALRRLVDYRIVGATPKQGTLTLDPNLITREKNLAKQGANSREPAAQRLSIIEAENNTVLIQNLNKLGADQAVEPSTIGQVLEEFLRKTALKFDDHITDLYKVVRTADGKFAPLDGKTFAINAKKALMDGGKDRYLPAEIKADIAAILKGKFQEQGSLNVSTSAQLKSTISTALRSHTLDGNVKQALSIVRNELENTKLLNPSLLGKDALKAEQAARKFTADYKRLQEKVPALKALYDKNMSADKFFDKHILGADTKQLKATIEFADANTVKFIKNNILGHIKSKALNGSPDEIGKISGSALRKVLFGKGGLGLEKLKLLFTKEEITKLKAISNVSNYEQHIPIGSAVNTSNTSGALYGILEQIGSSSILNRIPGGQALLGTPAREIALNKSSNVAQDISGILTKPNIPVRSRDTLSPYISSLLQGEKYNPVLYPSDPESEVIHIIGGGKK